MAIEKLLSGNRTSLLDAPIGIDASRERQKVGNALKAGTQEDKRVLHQGNMLLRQSLRKGDARGVMDAYAFMEGRVGHTGAGLGTAGADEAAGQKRLLDTQRRVGAFNGADPGTPLGQRQALFQQMAQTQADGGYVQQLRGKASLLGLTDTEWNNGLSRLGLDGQPAGGSLLAATNAQLGVPSSQNATAVPNPGASNPQLGASTSQAPAVVQGGSPSMTLAPTPNGMPTMATPLPAYTPLDPGSREGVLAARAKGIAIGAKPITEYMTDSAVATQERYNAMDAVRGAPKAIPVQAPAQVQAYQSLLGATNTSNLLKSIAAKPAGLTNIDLAKAAGGRPTPLHLAHGIDRNGQPLTAEGLKDPRNWVVGKEGAYRNPETDKSVKKYALGQDPLTKAAIAAKKPVTMEQIRAAAKGKPIPKYLLAGVNSKGGQLTHADLATAFKRTK